MGIVRTLTGIAQPTQTSTAGSSSGPMAGSVNSPFGTNVSLGPYYNSPTITTGTYGTSQTVSLHEYKEQIEQETIRLVCKRIEHILDGKDWGPGPAAGPWDRLNKKLQAVAKLYKCFEIP
jgi:hypothetical protein